MEDNIWKKLYRRWWWLGWFVIIPLIVYYVIVEITNSFVLGVIFSIVSLIIWILFFYISGLSKDF